jgi:hypothetical protein
MKFNEPSAQSAASENAELELQLQEALARRLRASELFGTPDWDEELDDDDDDDVAT